MRTGRFSLPLCVVVEQPLHGLAIALQRGATAKAALLPPVRSSSTAVTFELEVTVDGALPSGRPRLLGPFVQGPPDARFAYLVVGRRAGQAQSPWDGRIKVRLDGIGWEQIEDLPEKKQLVARIAGQSPKGGPALASVPLLHPGWAVG